MLRVITGCMFSGKSLELWRRVERATYARQTTLLIAPLLDTRSANTITTRAGKSLPAHRVEDSSAVQDLWARHPGVDLVAIDEVQLFDAGIVQVVNDMARHTEVVVAGLGTDFLGDTFGPMGLLLATADMVTTLSAVCVVCGADATRTQRLIRGQPARRGDPIILIGDSGTYEARCRGCHTVR